MSEQKKEEKYLSDLLKKIDLRLDEINEAVQGKSDEIDSMHKHMQDHKRDMDFLEKNAMREVIRNYSLLGTHGLENRKRLMRLKDTAYFGRIDFVEDNQASTRNLYIGVHNFQDTETKTNLVFDWRAPISSMFYDLSLIHI